jgi:hypothetical protein
MEMDGATDWLAGQVRGASVRRAIHDASLPGRVPRRSPAASTKGFADCWIVRPSARSNPAETRSLAQYRCAKLKNLFDRASTWRLFFTSVQMNPKLRSRDLPIGPREIFAKGACRKASIRTDIGAGGTASCGESETPPRPGLPSAPPILTPSTRPMHGARRRSNFYPAGIRDVIYVIHGAFSLTLIIEAIQGERS